MRWKKFLSRLARLLISLVLVAWLVRMAGANNILNHLAGANLLFIGLVMVSSNLDRVLMAYKWNALLAAKGIHIPLRTVTSAYYKATFWGSLFLPTIGSDAIRIYEVSRQARRSEDIISSVVLERAIGLVATVLVGLLGLGLFILRFEQDVGGILTAVLLLLAAAGAFIVLSLRLNWLVTFSQRSPWLSKWPVTAFLQKILASYQGYARHKRALLVFFLLSVVEQFFPVLDAYWMSQAFHTDFSLLTFVMFIPLISLLIRLPISFDGFGVREGAYIYLFGMVGMPESQAFLIGLLTTIVGRFGVAPPMLYFFLTDQKALPAAEADEVAVSGADSPRR